MARDPEPSTHPPGDVDRLVHEPARLLILSQLYVIDACDFLFMQKQTGLTKGNLSSHLARLEDAGYVEIVKEVEGKRPRTLLRLTQAGRFHSRKQGFPGIRGSTRPGACPAMQPPTGQNAGKMRDSAIGWNLE